MDEITEEDILTENAVHLALDRDFQREGFDATGLEGPGLTIGFSERLGADPWFIVVLVGTGWKVFDAVSNNATSRAIDKLLDFSRSRNKRLKLECEALKIDSRVEMLMVSIETASRSEFNLALRALPVLRDQVNMLLSKADDPIRELYFVWQEDHWQFSYYISVSGDIVDNL